MTNSKDLAMIAKKYRYEGIVKGVEFLLSPDKAISLIDDLARHGVLIVGCDLWRYLDQSKEHIVALLGAGIGIDSPVDESSVERNAGVVKEFLSEQLPQDAELVSLVLDDPAIADLFVE